MAKNLNINSPLFLEPPVSIRSFPENKIHDYYYKSGDNNQEENNIIITTEEGAFQFHRDTLKESLLELKTQAKKPISKLDKEHLEMYNNVVESLKVVHHSPPVYEKVLKDICDIFSDVGPVRPGTVGAFFAGCFTDTTFPGPIGCSPKCISSLQPNDEKITPCENTVLIYSENKLTLLNNKRTEYGYIYIDDEKFIGFTRKEIQEIKEYNVKVVTLIYSNEDGTYRRVETGVNVDELPKVANPSGKNTNNVGGMIFVIILVVLVILLLLLLLRNTS